MVVLLIGLGWLVVINNGLILQWLKPLNHNTPKTLPITFTRAHLNTSATRYWINTTSDSTVVSWRIYVCTLSQVGIMFNASGTHTVSCICIGY